MALINKLTSIADAIREKTGKTDAMSLDEMVTEIGGISGGGGFFKHRIEYTNNTDDYFITEIYNNDDTPIDTYAKLADWLYVNGYKIGTQGNNVIGDFYPAMGVRRFTTPNGIIGIACRESGTIRFCYRISTTYQNNTLSSSGTISETIEEL